MKKSKIFFTVLFFTLGGIFTLNSQEAGSSSSNLSASAIVERSRNRINSDTISTRYRMVITARNGSQSERLMDQYSKKDANGNNRTVIVFGEPASVRGTRFLNIENQGRENDQWIFLPSLGRVRRIAASEGSGSFVGSDFSYDDIASADRRVELDTHNILREERFRDRNCYVIESIPLDPNYQYSRMIQWIDRENYITYQIELYDRRGNHVKLLEILEFREVQGRLSPILTRMTNIQAGTSTSLMVVNLRYDDNIPEGVFTSNYLETGRY